MTDATQAQTPATDRIEVQMPPETKALLEMAAGLAGRSLTDFVIASVQAEALRIIQQHQTLTLTLEDSERFVEALNHPLDLSSELKQAAHQYKDAISS